MKTGRAASQAAVGSHCAEETACRIARIAVLGDIIGGHAAHIALLGDIIGSDAARIAFLGDIIGGRAARIALLGGIIGGRGSASRVLLRQDLARRFLMPIFFANENVEEFTQRPQRSKHEH